jgi:protoheme IX farnesyltransferase
MGKQLLDADDTTNHAPIVTQWFADLMLLTKARANVAVVATTVVGFALNSDIGANAALVLCTAAGTALLAGSASSANQALEHEFDRNMPRTRNRPIAAGRLGRRAGFALSGLLCVAGCLCLFAGVNPGAMLHGLLALVIYAGIYTPMKRRSPACTLVGAVSGALPLLIGWAATGARFGMWAAVTFAVLYLWQIPHFMAIAWWRRREYLGAGYRVLPGQDPDGRRTARLALVFTLGVLVVSLVPALTNQVTGWYLPGALVFGILFASFAVRFRMVRSEATARALFLASLSYLPAIFALMLFCQLRN